MGWSPGMTLDAVERDAIESALRFYRGNKTATARALGIAVRTLDNKLDQYAKEDDAQKAASDERARARAEELARARGLSIAVVGATAFCPLPEQPADAEPADETAAPPPAIPPPAATAHAKKRPAADDDLEDLLAPRSGRR